MSSSTGVITPPPGELAGRRIAIPTRALRQHGPIVALLIALIIANVALQPAIFSVLQIGLVVQTALPLLFVAFAQTLVIISRGLDLSVGAALAVGTVMTATTLSTHAYNIVFILLALAGIGLLNGVLVTFARFPAFIVTFASWSIFNGVALQVLHQDGGVVPGWLVTAVTGEAAGIPNSYWILIGALLFWWHLKRTRFGRNIYAVGSDEDRMRLNGVAAWRVRIGVFVLASVIAGLGGVILAGTTSTGQPTVGDGYILTSITAAVIGGTALAGGSGGVGLTVIGAFVLVLIDELVQALNLSSWVSVGAAALLLLIAVGLRAYFADSGEQVANA